MRGHRSDKAQHEQKRTAYIITLLNTGQVIVISTFPELMFGDHGCLIQ